jgi:RNA polymerase sigma-70 factor (ECF subfamily)
MALELLFSIYFPRLNDFARNVVRDDVISQDIVQEVFVKVWEKRSEIECINLEAFLFKLVRNRCIDYIKHLKVENNRMHKIQLLSKYEELYRIDFVGDEPYVLIEQELKQKIERTIQSLPERCREVFILSRINGLKNKEIAEKININIKNVERHLNRAMQAFRQNFSEELPIALIILVLKNLEF